MNVSDIIQALILERDRLNRAIDILQSGVKRRGRPPKALAAVNGAEPRKRRGMSPEKRREQSERMKRMWKARRAKKAAAA